MSGLPKVLVLNGPNTNLYGTLDPGTYGATDYAAIVERTEARGVLRGLDVEVRQSNHDGVLVDWIQEARQTTDALIVNGAGAAYVSVALYDALSAYPGPIIEVHMSNLARREDFRQRSFVALAAMGTISGFGPFGYELAVDAVAQILASGGGEDG
ncbi:MAG: type II 3-dehydroquinate dehydratase [Pseudomonadota bacterium]